jgi:D-alanyl-D-alanine carboxypeptidase/D-alanyl-D-alanine-endopeptidase (penicillin-binding protein 4)
MVGARLHRTIVAAVAGLAGAAALIGIPAAQGAPPAGSPVSAQLARIAAQARYHHSDWGYQVVDQRTGAVLVSRNARKMFDPGSTMKLYSVATALRLYGPGHRFRTPVYRQGAVAGGTLTGNLVLVASGDMSMGLRERRDGSFYYDSLPKVDHSYANIGLPGAVEPPGDPLKALDELAGKVRASGITAVAGDVVVDDRLFTPYDGFPDGLVSPVWINENLVDLMVRPGAVGAPASIRHRPATASYTVVNRVSTVPRGRPTTLTVAEPTPGTIVVSGRIAAGSPPTLRVWEVADPAAFARTAFIEALGRAGVTVAAPATGPNPAALLPPTGSYAPADLLGRHVSGRLSELATLILKVSHNRGADLMTCLAAARSGSTDCAAGIAAEGRTIRSLGVPSSSVFPFDGAGSDDQGRTTPAALVTFLRGAARAPYGSALFRALPVLGRDGTLANVQARSPAAGHAQLKTGNRVVASPAGKLIVLGNSLAGYARTRHGRRVVFMVAVGNVPIRSPADFLEITDDQARMVVAIQQGL